MSQIILQIPLIKYLRNIARTYGGAKYMFVTKTMGGQVYLSAEAPGDISGENEEYKNEIGFEGFYMRLSKDIYQYFELKSHSHRRLDEILKEIKEKEKA
ncbi:hypothetical protein ACSVC9_10575 [Clostridium sp. LBM24168]